MKTICNLIIILFIFSEGFSQQTNVNSDNTRQTTKTTYIKGGYGIHNKSVNSKAIENNAKIEKEKASSSKEYHSKVSYRKGGYGTYSNNKESYEENGRVILNKKVNSNGNLVITYISKKNIENEDNKEKYHYSKSDDVLKVEKNRKGNTIITYKSDNSNRHYDHYYQSNKNYGTNNSSIKIKSSNNIDDTDDDGTYEAYKRNKQKSLQKSQNSNSKRLKQYQKEFSIYKEVVDPETKEVKKVYDFSSEQYIRE